MCDGFFHLIDGMLERSPIFTQISTLLPVIIYNRSFRFYRLSNKNDLRIRSVEQGILLAAFCIDTN